MSRAARPRRQRSATESLLSIVLGLEAALVFFVTLVVFGLDLLPAGIAFLGGGLFVALLLLGGSLLRYRGGLWFAGLLQAALIATGLLVPLMFIVGSGFVAIFVYYLVKGRQLDRRNAANAESARTEGEQ